MSELIREFVEHIAGPLPEWQRSALQMVGQVPVVPAGVTCQERRPDPLLDPLEYFPGAEVTLVIWDEAQRFFETGQLDPYERPTEVETNGPSNSPVITYGERMATDLTQVLPVIGDGEIGGTR